VETAASRRPAFYFDLASPEAYLVAERIISLLPAAEWIPIAASRLPAATYARQIGRAVAFSLAAFRQAFAAGRDLGMPDSVLIAGAACEMHPRAILKGASLASIAAALEEATALAEQRGIRDVPALWLPDGRVFHGEDALDGVARALTA
jgi:2-hydroxychromene-2-carboxylate isomerase